MTSERRTLRKIGLGAFVAYLLLPEVALFLLVGIATSSWLAGLLAAGSLAGLVVVYAAKRSTGFLGRVFGTVDYDPLDYSQWTRHLVIKPLAVSLPASFALVLAAVVTVAYDASVATTIVVMVAGALIGFTLGGWLWLRWEDNRKGRA